MMGKTKESMPNNSEQAPKARPIRDIHTQARVSAKARPPRKMKLFGLLRHPKTKLFLVIVIGLLAALFARNYMHTRDELAQNDPVKLAAQIGKFLELPTDEAPTLATVKDANKLRSQSFFAPTQDGDKVLIYSKAGKAVLYRPGTKKVMAYTPINLEDAPK